LVPSGRWAHVDTIAPGGAEGLMRCWIFFHRDLHPDLPEVKEILRFDAVANKLGIDLSVLKPREFDLVVDHERDWSATFDGRRLPRPDAILCRTGAETSYFTLAVLRHFERQGVMLFNGSRAIESVADKLHTLQILSRRGLPIPKTILGKFPVDLDLVARELGFPVVVKTLKGTRGAGVVLCNSKAEFNDLADLLDGAEAGADFLFQQYIGTSHGRDVRVLVVDGRAVAAMERRSCDGSFKSNISLGGQATCFDTPPDMADLAIRTAKALDLDVAGVDILFDKDGYRICEANSSPGFQALEPACNICVPEIIFSAMQARLEEKSAKVTPVWRRLVDGLSPRSKRTPRLTVPAD
jgi:gamma-F420-2:alpha-L-glutamate ligase